MARVFAAAALLVQLVSASESNCIAQYGQCLSATDDNTNNCCAGSYCDGKRHDCSMGVRVPWVAVKLVHGAESVLI